MAARTRRKPLADVVAAGDRSESLRALRDFLARSLSSVEPDKAAPLAKQLADVLRELDGLPQVKEANPVDDLASRRASRRSAAAG